MEGLEADMTVKHQTWGCIAVCAVALLFSACQTEEPPPEIIRPVRYMEVSSTQGHYVRTFSGVAQSGTESRLSFRVPGTVQTVAVQVGDSVRAGDLIAALNPYDYELRVQQAEAALTRVDAQARNARVSYTRARTLYERQSASKADLDAARVASEASDAEARAQRRQLELARSQLGYTRITAPLEGVIAQVNVEVSENVQAGMPVVLLTSGSQIEVRTSVPEIFVAQIEEGSTAAVTFDAVPEKEFAATITEIGVMTGIATTYPVILLVNQPDADIRAGMVATASFQFKLDDNRIRFLLPSYAVGEDRQGRFVFLVDPIPGEEGFGLIRRRSVVTGELTANGMEVLEGLQDGDRVVTAGVDRILDGQKVKM
jgi:RND family efflux transporter MFP subunit